MIYIYFRKILHINILLFLIFFSNTAFGTAQETCEDIIPIEYKDSSATELMNLLTSDKLGTVGNIKEKISNEKISINFKLHSELFKVDENIPYCHIGRINIFLKENDVTIRKESLKLVVIFKNKTYIPDNNELKVFVLKDPLLKDPLSLGITLLGNNTNNTDRAGTDQKDILNQYIYFDEHQETLILCSEKCEDAFNKIHHSTSVVSLPELNKIDLQSKIEEHVEINIVDSSETELKPDIVKLIPKECSQKIVNTSLLADLFLSRYNDNCQTIEKNSHWDLDKITSSLSPDKQKVIVKVKLKSKISNKFKGLKINLSKLASVDTFDIPNCSVSMKVTPKKGSVSYKKMQEKPKEIDLKNTSNSLYIGNDLLNKELPSEILRNDLILSFSVTGTNSVCQLKESKSYDLSDKGSHEFSVNSEGHVEFNNIGLTTNQHDIILFLNNESSKELWSKKDDQKKFLESFIESVLKNFASKYRKIHIYATTGNGNISEITIADISHNGKVDEIIKNIKTKVKIVPSSLGYSDEKIFNYIGENINKFSPKGSKLIIYGRNSENNTCQLKVTSGYKEKISQQISHISVFEYIKTTDNFTAKFKNNKIKDYRNIPTYDCPKENNDANIQWVILSDSIEDSRKLKKKRNEFIDKFIKLTLEGFKD